MAESVVAAVMVNVSFDGKKKIRKFPAEFSEKNFTEAIQDIFPSLGSANWHAETIDGAWIEDKDDWSMAVEAHSKFQTPLELIIVNDDAPAPSMTKSSSANATAMPSMPSAPSLPAAAMPLTPTVIRSGACTGGQSMIPYMSPSGQTILVPSPTLPVSSGVQYVMMNPANNKSTGTAAPQGKTSSHDEKMELLWHEAVCIMREKNEPMDALYIRKCFPNERKPRVKELNYILYRELEKQTVSMVQLSDEKPKWNLIQDPFEGKPLPLDRVAKVQQENPKPQTGFRQQQDHKLRIDRMRNEVTQILQQSEEPMNVLWIRKNFSWPENERPKVKELNFILYDQQRKGLLVKHEDGKKPTWSLAT